MSTIGGKNYKKFKKESKVCDEKKYYISKNDFADSIYAKVSRMMGSGRLIAIGEDKKEYNCVIRGRLYKKEWIKTGDILIILARDYEKKNTADVLHKLSEAEIIEYNASDLFFQNEAGVDDIQFDTNVDQEQFSFDDL
jgi:translation initiation factor 1A